MARLDACPFCRALFTRGEAKQCPDCDLKLLALENLPPSLDAATAEFEAGELVLPEHQVLPWNYFGRMRGALLAIALLGLLTFFTPWVELRMPDLDVRSGFDLARGRAGWLWGGAAAWFVMVPLVWTRRTVQRMRGVRLVTALLAAMTLLEVAMLLSTPPHAQHHLPLKLEWRWGIYASLLTSLLGISAALRLGGNLQDLPRRVTALTRVDADQTSSGRTLH